MKQGFLKSSPHFFRRIGMAMAAFVTAVLLLAAVVPAPLQEQADPGRVPNPVKSAWFLLWIQELVSYAASLANLVLLLALFTLLLPWLPGQHRTRHASWLAPERRLVNLATLSLLATILLLTAVAMFCRGENWSLVAPF